MRQWWLKIKRGFGRRRNLTDELQQEMDAHLQFLIDENLERGIPLEEARAAARREFGNAATVRERSYQSWQFPTFESLLQDVRYAMRGIVRAPIFSLIVILTLAVGIGANTAIFSAVYAVLLKPLAFPSGDRLVWLGESSAKATGISVTWVNFEHWRTENHSFETMAGFQNADLTLTGRGQAMLTHAGLVTNEFFHLTGSRPIIGRLFSASDGEPQSAATVVVTENFWAKTLGGDSQIIGKALTLNGNSYVVIGVLARDQGSSCGRWITTFHSALRLRRQQNVTHMARCAFLLCSCPELRLHRGDRIWIRSCSGSRRQIQVPRTTIMRMPSS
jgi:putative ABC transport system permease protein